ncbi:MAG: glutamate racemase [Puniceicoccales bacterium]|jgi:glutamate racemase|nr:glutamate racemase [Puniceicoccales bacterium]
MDAPPPQPRQSVLEKSVPEQSVPEQSVLVSSEAIGVFDSGVGGLSVLREIAALLPAENTLYVADTAHCPYGGKTAAEVVARCVVLTDFLLERGSKLIVVACNTATALAIDTLRARYPQTPFVGLEPAVKPAALESRSGVIGVLATAGTFRGRHFNETRARHAKGAKIVTADGAGLVELVESGAADSPEAELLLRKLLAPILAAGADTLVLGCTHYPFLEPAIRRVAGGALKIVSSGVAVARRIHQVLAQNNHLAPVASVAPASAVALAGRSGAVGGGYSASAVAPAASVAPAPAVAIGSAVAVAASVAPASAVAVAPVVSAVVSFAMSAMPLPAAPPARRDFFSTAPAPAPALNGASPDPTVAVAPVNPADAAAPVPCLRLAEFWHRLFRV